MSCADLIGHLFLARDVTHSVHLNTRSYAKHKALGPYAVQAFALVFRSWWYYREDLP